jgi:hypothetical protein
MLSLAWHRKRRLGPVEQQRPRRAPRTYQPRPRPLSSPTLFAVTRDMLARGLAAAAGAAAAAATSDRPANGFAGATSPPPAPAGGAAAAGAASAAGAAAPGAVGVAPPGPRRARTILRFARVASSALELGPHCPGSWPCMRVETAGCTSGHEQHRQAPWQRSRMPQPPGGLSHDFPTALRPVIAPHTCYTRRLRVGALLISQPRVPDRPDGKNGTILAIDSRAPRSFRPPQQECAPSSCAQCQDRTGPLSSSSS